MPSFEVFVLTYNRKDFLSRITKGVGEQLVDIWRVRRKKVSQTKASNQEYYKTDTVGGAIG